MTAPEKGRWYWAKNWLHYHWLYLIIAAVVLWVGISWLANALHWGETLPDYQIAYVGKSALPEDTAHAIEAAFAQYGEDLNGDGTLSASGCASTSAIQRTWKTLPPMRLRRRCSFFPI